MNTVATGHTSAPSGPEITAVILAAGLGTRLGRPLPKPLTVLSDGRTILGRQVDHLRGVFGSNLEIMVVVGFKLEMILESIPDVAFAYNEAYDQTNTSKSLLKALRLTGGRGVLWLNGDVVFDAAVLERVRPLIASDKSFICVNTAAVGAEEVKYTVDQKGLIRELSKTVDDGLGEAVGINFVASRDKLPLIEQLDSVGDQDYFERAVELAIQHDRCEFTPVDISDLFAVEVDFQEDLEHVNEHL